MKRWDLRGYAPTGHCKNRNRCAAQPVIRVESAQADAPCTYDERMGMCLFHLQAPKVLKANAESFCVCQC